MKWRVSRVILGCYDLILGLGAIYYGIQMISGSWEISFGQWPQDWIGRVPFTSWFWPGIIAIVLYGLGNLLSAYFAFIRTNKWWVPSLVMGVIFLVSLILSIPVLGDVYLATGEFIVLSIIQLIFGAIAFTIKSKVASETV